ncbi:NUDIX hydrolase domain-like protein [Ilyonectria destructans]|nr:NUDIX hydrolase domain-like protein [Ilyonectria destructans]
MADNNNKNEKTEKATLLQLIAVNDSYPYNASSFDPLYRLYLPRDDRPHGYLLPEVVEKMPWTKDFKITHENPRRVDVLDSSDGKDTSAACNKALAKVVTACQEKDLFNLKGEQYEEFAIVGVQYPVRLFRYAAPLFGIVSQGAHLTAYIRTSSGLKIWVPRRSPTISTFPNKLDSTVAGGISAEDTPFETIIREAEEEASLTEDLTRRDVLSAGVLTYITLLEQGQGEVGGLIKPDMVYVYDLEVSEDVIPKPHDDEVKEFYLMTPDEIKTALLRKEFKTNSAAVMIDFFIRHGIITADNERDYTEMSMRLHRTLPFATAPRL